MVWNLQGAAQAEHNGAAGDGVVNNHERPGGQSFEKHGEYLRGAALPGAASSSLPARESRAGGFLACSCSPFHPQGLPSARAPQCKVAPFLVHPDPVPPDVTGTGPESTCRMAFCDRGFFLRAGLNFSSNVIEGPIFSVHTHPLPLPNCQVAVPCSRFSSLLPLEK